MNTEQAHRLTIAYDAKRAFLNYRGLGNYSRNLLAQMARFYSDGHYLLCTPQDKGLYPWLGEKPFERIMPTGLWQISPALWRRYGIPGALRDRKVDICHGLSQELPEGIERLGCKTVVTMHDAIFMRYPELYSATYCYSFIRRNESACRRADRIIAISEQTKRDYMEFFHVPEERIRVVYQGCNECYWQPVSEASMHSIREKYRLPSEYVLSVGALEPRKNQLRLIKAMASAHIALPVVLVGRGNIHYRQQLQDTAKRYGVVLQIIDNACVDEMPALYRMASVFAYPSLFEGFGIPILEAARCEVPIVASRGICFEEIAGEGALYASPTDVEELGHALSHILNDSAQQKQRVLTALANTERFCAQTVAHDLMQVYEEIL